MHRGRLGRTIAGAAAALLCAGSPTVAQVLEIRPDGSIARYSGPMVRLSIGARPIQGPIRYADIVLDAPSEVAAAIKEAARRHALPASILEAVAWQESRFNQRAVSPKGARGVMQLMPATARGLGVDPSNLSANVEGGAAYLAQQLRRFGDLRLALAAYNAGPEAVDRYGDVPPFAETQNYVASILAYLEAAVVLGAPSE